MIRVIARDYMSGEGLLIGDFPPSEIPALVQMLRDHDRVFLDEDGTYIRLMVDMPTQFVPSAVSGVDRLVMEILFEANSDGG